MSFTDRELKRLKDNMGWDQDWVLKSLPNLLARLEAAEAYCAEVDGYVSARNILEHPVLMQLSALWRKAAGKAGA